MKEVSPTVPEVAIVAKCKPESMLKDRRIGRYGLVFGRISDVCRQYGIKYEVLPNNLMKFWAPKHRLQIFIEKLHFAMISYR